MEFLFQYPIILPFHTVHGVLKARTEVVCHSLLQWTTSSNNTREDSTHGHHQTVNTEIRLITLFVAKEGKALYSQQKQDQELTVVQIMNALLPNSDLN